MPRTLSRNRFHRRTLSLIVSIGALASVALPTELFDFIQPTARAAATFTVNSTGDGADSNITDGVCDDGTGHCTLRAAIQQANATPGTDTINFQLGSGVQTIVFATTPPDITDPIVIDGTTQPAYSGTPLIELSATPNILPPVSWALHITAGNSTVRGLSIGPFSVTGILLGGNGGNKVESCYIGLRSDGMTKAPIGGGCVTISGSPNNVIGGTSAAARNVLSGCGTGVSISGATGNVIQGNYIGTNAAGTAALSNGSGVSLGSVAANNTIGGTAAGAGNLISGNLERGITMSDGTSANKIQGNVIGLAADGKTALGNGTNGVEVINATDYVIGGTDPGAGNVISANGGNGIQIGGGSGHVVQGNLIGTDSTGTLSRGNALAGVFLSSSNNLVGGTVAAARNIISGNHSDGVRVVTLSGNSIQGNYIGTNVAGIASVSNSGDGVLILNASNNVIGGDTSGARNVISGNLSNGVEIRGDSGMGVSGASSNVVKGNYIGTNAAGTAPLGNTGDDVHVGGVNNVIGGLTATPGVAPGNLISGSFTHIFVGGTGTIIQGNLIGTDASGTSKLMDGSFGVACWGPQTTIGGTQAGSRNVISGSSSGNADGIEVANAGTAVIQGNFIGTDISGSAVIGNRGAGIEVDSLGVTIGGTTPAAGNVISGNGTGVSLRGGASTVQGNLIGTDSTGTAPLGNTGDGVRINFSAHNSTVGGTMAGAGNLIAFNGGAGIAVTPDSFAVGSFTSANTLRGNSVFSNSLLGIDLVAPGPPLAAIPAHDGLTLNDPGDPDAGPNGLQNSPVVLSVTTSGGTTNVQGTLNSKPNATFTIDFYANAVCDASGAGEGQSFAGSTAATTDANGDATFSTTFLAPSAGQIITATATDAAGNTSEFSVCNVGSAPGTVQFASASYSTTEHDGAATITVTRTLGTASAATVDYATSDGTALAGQDYAATSGTLSFAAGETTKTFNIPVTNDTLNEDNETVNLKLSNPTGGIPLGAQSAATLTIIDDDPPPVVAFLGGKAFGGTVFVAEGNSGTTDAIFTVALSAPSGKTVSVNFNTADGTAQSPADYQAASSTLVFNPGETKKTVAVAVNGDTIPESDESFTLALSNPVNATFPQFQPTPPFAVGVIWDDDSPGIHFSAPNYVVNEKDGSTTISVVRRGDASAAASVDYSATGIAATPSANDTVASNRADFTPAFGTLRFAPGESEKSFTVLVNDDAFVENPETVSLALSNPSDAPQGTTYNANLMIISDDTSAPTAANNPVDDSQFFVQQHYHDFLNREPDTSGLQFWAGGITGCGSDTNCTAVKRINTSAAFFLSIEFQQTGYLVERMYKTAFGDATANSSLGGGHRLSVPVVRLGEFLRDAQEVGNTPTQVIVGQGNWQQQLEDNKNAFALEFVGRQRFANAFPSTLTADQFVNQLNTNAGGVLTSADIAQFDSAFGGASASSNDAAKRAQVLRAVAENATLKQQEFNRAFVLMQYIGYLRRNPDDAPDADYTGFDFWLTKLNQFNGNFVQAEMVKAFIFSTEYRQRFGQ